MKSKTIAVLAAVTVLAALAVGCTQKVSTLDLVSTDSIDLGKKYVQVATDVSAKASSTFILLFFDVEDMNYYKAIGDCLAENDGDLMTDVEITTTSYWFLVGVYTEYKVKGNVWRAVDDMGSVYSPDQLYEYAVLNGKPHLVSGNGLEVHEIFFPGDSLGE